MDADKTSADAAFIYIQMQMKQMKTKAESINKYETVFKKA